MDYLETSTSLGQRHLRSKRRSSINTHNTSLDDYSLNSSGLNSSKKSTAHCHLTDSEYHELMRKKKLISQLNARKEKRHFLIEKSRGLNERDIAEEEEEENAHGMTMTRPIGSGGVPAFSTVSVGALQSEETLSKKSFGSNLVKKVTNSIKNRFNTLVKSTKAPQVKAPTVFCMKPPQQPTILTTHARMRRSTSAYNVAAHHADRTKCMRKQNSVSSCSSSSMSSLSSFNSTNTSAYSNQKIKANLPAQQGHHISNLSLASKENKKPPFRSSFKVTYNDSHLYQKVSSEISYLGQREENA